MRARTFRGARRLVVVAGLVLMSAFGSGGARAEQSPPPPIQGVTGTIATDETIRDADRAGRGIFGKIARLFGLGRADSVRGPDDAAADETFRAVTTGARVVLQDATSGGKLTAEDIDRLHDEGATQTEAVVAAVNRSDRTIVVRVSDGARQTLRFVGRADAVNAAVNGAADGRVFVVVRDAAGGRIALVFSRVS